MTASPDLATAEKELKAARSAFNTARKTLDATLSRYGAREGAVDHVIHHADAYGVDHTVNVIAKTPNILDLQAAIPQTALSPIRTQLKHAYEAMHRADLAMADRENLARTRNPSHGKAILIADREVLFDANANTLRDRNSGDVVKADAKRVNTEQGGPNGKRDKDRDH